MTISLKRFSLSKPKKGERIPLHNLSFVRARNRNKAHSKILELFEESDISKSELARMLGKKPEQITRWLSGPGNLTLDTLSDLIFAISGNFVFVECKNELDKPRANMRSAEWLTDKEVFSERKTRTIAPIAERKFVTTVLNENNPRMETLRGRSCSRNPVETAELV